MNYENTQEFIKKLPKRTDYIKSCELNGEPVLFLPNSISELNIDFKYKLLLVGILENGTKAAVLINNIKPYFDILINNNETEILNRIKLENLKILDSEIVNKHRFKEFNPEPLKWLRIYFNNTFTRKKCLELTKTCGWETASNDETCYYRKVCRNSNMSLGSWNLISNYKVSQFCKKPVELTLIVDLENIQEQDITNKDKSIIQSWDIETYSHVPTGEIQKPENEDDVVKMISTSFGWYWSKQTFLTVNITDMPCPDRNDCLIIRCKNQKEILEAFILISSRMGAEFIIGFNDSMFDWPFIMKKLEYFNIFNSSVEKLSVLNPEIGKYANQGRKTSVIKLEADSNIDAEFMYFVGSICFDIRTLCRQIYKKSQKTNNLNYFLEINNLGSKEDMSYYDMAIIFRILYVLEELSGSKNYETILEYLKKYDGNLRLFNQIKSDYVSKYEYKINLKSQAVKEYSNIEKYTVNQIIQMVEKATLIVKYCNVDAIKCHELMYVRNIVSDKREMANLCKVNMEDSFYRADGVKVRNVIMMYGDKRDIVFNTFNTGTKTEKKYPGAFVFPPKKGLYARSLIDKRALRKSFINTKQNIITDPTNINFTRELLDPDFDIKYPITKEELNSPDTNNITDRPCGGQDFSSLYPNEIITHNLSPEKLIRPKMIEYMKLNYKKYQDYEFNTKHIEFLYGTKDEINKPKITADFIKYNPKTLEGMGLYPHVLKIMFDKRSLIKKELEEYKNALEFLEKINDETIESALETEKQKRLNNLNKANSKVKQSFYKEQLDNIISIETFLKKHNDSIQELIQNFQFKCNYLDKKQNALKVFMNTFYGEAGNQLSPFFTVEVAGATTVCGQESIKLVYEFVTKKGWDVKYGDTDSIYPTPPDNEFQEIDNKYYSGKISKIEYWSEMVELSMELMDKLRDDINLMLFDHYKTKFLKMAYEEILFPFAMLGKKKYIGIQHQKIVNFGILTQSLDKYQKNKSLFIRGLDLVKRNSSEFLHVCTYEIIKQMFDPLNNKTMKTLVLDTISSIKQRNWQPNLFIKTSKYKLPGKKKHSDEEADGNKTIMIFADRMRELHKNHPEFGITAPVLGESYKYIINKKDPYVYDLKGRKSKLLKGYKIEYYDSLFNKLYNEYNPIEIDIDDYVTNELIGSLARFIIYDNEYDKYFTQDMYENDQAYKEADKKAHDEAKRILINIYESNYGTKYQDLGIEKKQRFKQLNNQLKSLDNYDMINIMNKIALDEETNNNGFTNVFIIRKLKEAIVKQMQKEAKTYARATINSFKTSGELLSAKKLFMSRYKIYKNTIEKQISNYINELDKMEPKIKEIMLNNRNLISENIKNNIDIVDQVENIINNNAELFNELEIIKNNIKGCYMSLEELELNLEKFNNEESRFTGNPIADIQKKNNKEELEKFLILMQNKKL